MGLVLRDPKTDVVEGTMVQCDWEGKEKPMDCLCLCLCLCLCVRKNHGHQKVMKNVENASHLSQHSRFCVQSKQNINVGYVADKCSDDVFAAVLGWIVSLVLHE